MTRREFKWTPVELYNEIFLDQLQTPMLTYTYRDEVYKTVNAKNRLKDNVHDFMWNVKYAYTNLYINI